MNLLEVFVTCLIVYIYLTILLRLFGKKEFSQLNVFDFVVFLIIAEIMTMSIGDDTLTLLHSVVATITLILTDRVVSLIGLRFKKARDVLEGRPTYLIFKGKLDQKKMRELRYTVDDLCHQLRVSDVDCISKVEFAILETNGSLSVITKDNCSCKLPDSLICDGIVDEECLTLLGKNKQWLEEELLKLGYHECEDIFYCVLEKTGLYVIKKEE